MTTIGEDFKLTSEYTALHELGYVVSSSGGSSHVEVRRADGTVIDKYLSIKAAYSDLVGIPTGKSPETVIEERLGGDPVEGPADEPAPEAETTEIDDGGPVLVDDRPAPPKGWLTRTMLAIFDDQPKRVHTLDSLDAKLMDLADDDGFSTYGTRNGLYSALSKYAKEGEIERVDTGEYRKALGRKVEKVEEEPVTEGTDGEDMLAALQSMKVVGRSSDGSPLMVNGSGKVYRVTITMEQV